MDLQHYLNNANDILEAARQLESKGSRTYVFGQISIDDECHPDSYLFEGREAHAHVAWLGVVDGKPSCSVIFRTNPELGQDFPSDLAYAQKKEIEAAVANWLTDPFNKELPCSGSWDGPRYE